MIYSSILTNSCPSSYRSLHLRSPKGLVEDDNDDVPAPNVKVDAEPLAPGVGAVPEPPKANDGAGAELLDARLAGAGSDPDPKLNIGADVGGLLAGAGSEPASKLKTDTVVPDLACPGPLAMGAAMLEEPPKLKFAGAGCPELEVLGAAGLEAVPNVQLPAGLGAAAVVAAVEEDAPKTNPAPLVAATAVLVFVVAAKSTALLDGGDAALPVDVPNVKPTGAAEAEALPTLVVPLPPGCTPNVNLLLDAETPDSKLPWTGADGAALLCAPPTLPAVAPSGLGVSHEAHLVSSRSFLTKQARHFH